MFKIIESLLTACLIANSAAAEVRIVASTSDLASIAREIGREHVDVDDIVSGKSNPHFVEVLPSYMVKLARADLYLSVGLGLDYWAQYIIDGSRNGKLVIMDCSDGIEALEKPTGKIDASMGDIHPSGNPHYWLDPENGKIIAANIEKALSRIDPSNSEYYRSRLLEFENALDSRIHEWRAKAAALDGAEIIAFHNSWPYLSAAFGIKIRGFIEPKPGIEPTPSHTAELIELVRAGNIKLIVKEPYFSDRVPLVIAREAGATVVELPLSVGGNKSAMDYFALFDYIVDSLLKGLGRN